MKAGTLFHPSQRKAFYLQSLILREDVKIQMNGKNTIKLTLKTACFNGQLRPPGRDEYFLSNIRSTKYKEGMNQA